LPRGAWLILSSIQVKNIDDGVVWELINVYGPIQDEKKLPFSARDLRQDQV
jgi:hypothetical protein